MHLNQHTGRLVSLERGRHASAQGLGTDYSLCLEYSSSRFQHGSLTYLLHITLSMRPTLTTQFKTATLSLTLLAPISLALFYYFPPRLLPSNNLRCLLIYNVTCLLSVPLLEKVPWRRDLFLFHQCIPST